MPDFRRERVSPDFDPPSPAAPEMVTQELSAALNEANQEDEETKAVSVEAFQREALRMAEGTEEPI
ncbi:MAG: hypothetical protein U0670_14320 [Anaerolineae bacterium]